MSGLGGVVFVGLGPGALLAWFVALGLPIIGLYLLRVRRRRVVVPFLGLLREWSGESRRSAAPRRVHHLLSLLLQLLLLALLLVSLADPRPEAAARGGRSIALLIDVSASMSVPERGVPRIVRAREAALELVRSTSPSDEVLVIELGGRPRPRGGFSREREIVEGIVAGLEALDTPADLPAALRLADDALRGRERAEIVLVSDGAFSEEALAARPRHRLSYRAVTSPPSAPSPPVEPGELASGEDPPGPPLDNVGLVAFAARRYPRDVGAFEVLANVRNASSEPREVELTIFAEDGPGPGLPLELVRLVVAPRETTRYVRANLTGARERLRAQLRRVDGRVDGLTRDDVAFALLPPPRHARILVVGEPNTFLDAALLADPGLEVTRVSEVEYPPPGSFELTVFDGTAPERVARTGAALYLGVPSGERPSYPLRLGAELTGFGFDRWERDDPLFAFLDPYDVQVLRGRALVAGPADRVLGRSEQGTILVLGERPAGRFLALGFDPRDSDFVLRIAFPVFVSNALDRLLEPTAQPAQEASHLTTGRATTLGVSHLERGTAEVRGPQGPHERVTRLPVLEHGLVFAPERAGFYRLEAGGASRPLAASLVDEQESSLPPRAQLVLGGEPAPPLGALEPYRQRLPWIWLLAVAWLLAVVEWFTFHRRWTV